MEPDDDEPAYRVLAVDDDTDIRSLVEFTLSRAGFDVATADNGPAALDTVRSWRPDLVVLDVAMPGMNGYDVCKELRNDPALADIPVIMLTARATDEFTRLGYAAGTDLYLTKPFSPRVLLDRVDTLLHPG